MQVDLPHRRKIITNVKIMQKNKDSSQLHESKENF